MEIKVTRGYLGAEGNTRRGQVLTVDEKRGAKLIEKKLAVKFDPAAEAKPDAPTEPKRGPGRPKKGD